MPRHDSLSRAPSRTATAVAVLALGCAAARLAAQTSLTPEERRVRSAIAALRDEQVAYLQRVVDIPSSTPNLEGVRRVGSVFRASLDSLGFTTHWVPMPDSMRRAGHLIAEHRGRPGAVRMVLIGHFDTVVEPDGPSWVREDSTARGIGAADMKGGDVIILHALKALRSAGALQDLNLTVVFTGDEEAVGRPIDVARAALLDAARRSDVALAFEGGNRSDATVARRGSSSWRLTATGRQAHSAGIFGRGAGFGAIYELARVLDAFRTQLAGEQGLTFNVAAIAGGTDVTYDTAAGSWTAAGKGNVVPRTALAHGDLRFVTPEQLERTRTRMREIVAQHLPVTDAEIGFADAYPAMPPTPGGARILALYDAASRDLGYGAVTALDPERRGAGDLSFVAPLIDGMDGLGALGSGAHAPGERINLSALPMQTERAALLMLRLGARPASEFSRPPSP